MLTCIVFIQIADFGMARDVADDSYYIIKGGKIPIKWTPPEVSWLCIAHGNLVLMVVMRVGLDLHHNIYISQVLCLTYYQICVNKD